MNIAADGLVLKRTGFKESDLFLTILTAEYGIIKASAGGARAKLSRMLSGTQLFSYSRFTIFKNRGRFTVDAAESIEQFFELSSDIGILSLASYFSELLTEISDTDIPGPEILRLALSAFYALVKGKIPPGAVKAVFELKLMDYAGFKPVLDECLCCGIQPRNGSVFLNPSEGGIYCGDCAVRFPLKKSVPLSNGALLAMRHILSSDVKKAFLFRLSEPSLALLTEACEAYVLTQLDKSFKTLEIYKSINSGGVHKK